MEKTDNRPSWDAVWMLTARAMAKRANCMKKVQVGAVIVKDKRQIASGYNGAPPGEPTCQELGECLVIEEMGSSCQRVLHAEENAILQNSRDCRGATLYITHFPCLNCMRKIVAVGIKKVVYLEMYKPEHYKERYNQAKMLANSAGITLTQLLRKDGFAIIHSNHEDLVYFEKVVQTLPNEEQQK